jgi:hypothetical protein
MRGIAAFLVCGLLGASSAQAADCKLNMLGSVEMQVTPDSLMLPVTFANGTQKTFAFDIGAGLNVIAQDAASQADFHFRSLDPNIQITAYGQKVERLGNSPKFHIGTLPGDDVEFAVVPRQIGDGSISGHLGNRLFEGLDFELDIAQHKLNAFSTDHCPEKVVYWTKGGFAELPIRREGTVTSATMSLDGQPLHVTLSTREGSLIGMNAVRGLFNLDENSPGMVLDRTTSDGHKYFRYPFKSLIVDALTIGNPNILIYDEAPKAGCNNRPRIQDMNAPQGHVVDKPMNYVTCFSSDMRIGLSVLSKLHIYYSSKEKIIYATGAGAH